jgi:diacylglycerol O-acyltransferase
VAYYERLSALDAAFLEIETPSCHMHVGIALLFETGPLAKPDGGLDIDAVRRFVAARIQHVPRYRQRLQLVPLQRHPVWVDDDGFNINYHVRHTALPRPGSEAQLKQLIGRINSQKLDRHRPLWEMWFVEGLDDGRFALLGKVHHCMIDGASGVDMMAALLRFDAEVPEVEPPERWSPRPAPRRSELLGEELRRQGSRAKGMLERFMQVRDDPQGAIDGLKEAAGNVLSTIGSGVVPASPTPLNPSAIGSYRRFDYAELSLAGAKQIKRTLGGTVNDVVLATVAGALRRYLLDKHIDVAPLDFRVLMPVNARNGKSSKLGNRVSVMLARLPLEERDPAKRLNKVSELTTQAKRSGQHQGAELVEELGDLTGTVLISQSMRLATKIRSYNLVVTNVPGPPMPLYLLGAKLEAAYPVVPLYLNQALGVAVFSYDGKLFIGLNADWDRLDDLEQLPRLLEQAFAELAACAAAADGQTAAETPETPDDEEELIASEAAACKDHAAPPERGCGP